MRLFSFEIKKLFIVGTTQGESLVFGTIYKPQEQKDPLVVHIRLNRHRDNAAIKHLLIS